MSGSVVHAYTRLPDGLKGAVLLDGPGGSFIAVAHCDVDCPTCGIARSVHVVRQVAGARGWSHACLTCDVRGGRS